ncbi:MAG TPA: T9SS type A sorting domain-containing protein [Bacteroidia bacterium]|nr:T9SS type A sorting domain-containing protein [Bacteroidia bacterium]
MKKLFLIVCLCLAVGVAKSQTDVYHPFPDSNAIWRVDWGEAYCYNNSHPQAHYQYEMQGDTLIGIYNYHKIVRVLGYGSYVCGPYYIPGAGYMGAIRQDTSLRQVYFVPKDTAQEQLLYDFNLSIGDTVPGKFIGGAIVQSIDSLLIGSTYRKTINFGYIIEGIGSTSGLLEPPSQLELTPELKCFIQDSIHYYLTGPCELPDIVFEYFSDENEGTLFPQPATDYVIFRFAGYHISYKVMVALFDIVGQRISLQYEIENDFIRINTSGIKPGIYQLHVQETTTQKKYFNKLIIQ